MLHFGSYQHMSLDGMLTLNTLDPAAIIAFAPPPRLPAMINLGLKSSPVTPLTASQRPGKTNRKTSAYSLVHNARVKVWKVPLEASLDPVIKSG